MGTSGKGEVLIVEDDEGIREAMRLMLELEGYRVATASNGKEGLDALERRQAPCVILLDLMMPVMDGWEFAEAIQKRPALSRIPLYVVTAFTDRTKPLPGALGVLNKPVEIDVLLSTVDRYCGI